MGWQQDRTSRDEIFCKKIRAVFNISTLFFCAGIQLKSQWYLLERKTNLSILRELSIRTLPSRQGRIHYREQLASNSSSILFDISILSGSRGEPLENIRIKRKCDVFNVLLRISYSQLMLYVTKFLGLCMLCMVFHVYQQRFFNSVQYISYLHIHVGVFLECSGLSITLSGLSEQGLVLCHPPIHAS